MLTDDGKIKTSEVSEDDIDGRFNNYVRKSTAFTDFDEKMRDLESELDNIILALRRKGILDYAGAVELQSNNTRKLSWTSGSMRGPLYKDMSYSLGQIWCKSTNSNIPTTGGSDEVSIGNVPLGHGHPQTKAETLTGPLASRIGGGQLIGDFTIGSKELVAQGSGYGPTKDAIASPLEHAVEENEMTYPLWGQNVLDWRTPKKTHNNVPPSLNIYVRYWEQSQATIREATRSVEDCEEMFKRISQIREAYGQFHQECAAEPQYGSSMACELPNYSEENLTSHDYVLRITTDGKHQVNLMRQSL